MSPTDNEGTMSSDWRLTFEQLTMSNQIIEMSENLRSCEVTDLFSLLCYIMLTFVRY